MKDLQDPPISNINKRFLKLDLFKKALIFAFRIKKTI